MKGIHIPAGIKAVALVATAFLIAGCVVAGPLSSLIAATNEPSISAASANPSVAPMTSPAVTQPDASPRPAASPEPAAHSVTGHLTSGPTCPVETVPPNPACAPKPVSGATVVATSANGLEAARAVSNADGLYTLELPAGSYTLAALSFADKMMRAPAGTSITVRPDTARLVVDFTYDTGIR